MRGGSGTGGKAAWLSLVGFACNQGFVFSLFYLGSNRAVGEGAFVFERAELFGTLLFMALSFVVLLKASPRVRDALLARNLLWCYAALLVVGSLVSELAGFSGAPGLVAECALIGVPAGLMLAAWGRAFGHAPIERAVPEVFIGSALGAAICFAFAVMPWPHAAFVLKLLPLGSAAALRLLGAAHGISRGFGASSDEAHQLSLKILGGTGVFGLAAGFMETYGSDPGMATTPTIPVTLFLFVLFCIAALQLFGPLRAAAGEGGAGVPGSQGAEAGASGDGGDEGWTSVRARQARSVLARGRLLLSDEGEGPLDGVYRLAVLLMMAGFLFVPVLGDFGVPGEAIVLAGYLGIYTVLASLFLVMGKISARDAALSFARGFGALFLGEMLGIALGNALDAISAHGQTPYVVVACAGLAVLFAYLFLFTERDFRALSVVVEDTDRFDDACRAIARSAGLSKREAEMLPLALKGRTGERMAAEFFVSKSTVDTHLRRIYAKCGVHSRQELIDLGERTERELAARR